MRERRSKTGIFLLILSALWLMVIWGHSMVPATASTAESDSVRSAAQAVLAALHLPVTLSSHLVRKFAHFSEYTLLGLLLTGGIRQTWRRESFCPMALWLGLLAPMVDETIQLFVDGRSGAVNDVWLDYVGFLTGMGIIFAVSHHSNTKKS